MIVGGQTRACLNYHLHSSTIVDYLAVFYLSLYFYFYAGHRFVSSAVMCACMIYMNCYFSQFLKGKANCSVSYFSQPTDKQQTAYISFQNFETSKSYVPVSMIISALI